MNEGSAATGLRLPTEPWIRVWPCGCQIKYDGRGESELIAKCRRRKRPCPREESFDG